MEKKAKNCLPRIQERALENWLEKKSKDIFDRGLTKQKLCEMAALEFDFPVTESNIQGAAKTVQIALPTERGGGAKEGYQLTRIVEFLAVVARKARVPLPDWMGDLRDPALFTEDDDNG